jgi:electron transfer flavoprotein alpha subunit
MAVKILAVLEQKEGRLNRFAFEAAAEAKKIADEIGLEAEAVIIGNEVLNINEISNFGLNKAVHFKNENLENYSPDAYRDIIADYAKEASAEYLLFSNTSVGKDLAPRIAVRLNAGCLMDCIKLEISSGEIIATRPVFAGKALIDAKLKSAVKIFTIRNNVFKASSSGNGKPPEIETREVKSPNLKTRIIEFKKAQEKIDVAEADIIVSGGRGLKGPENFYLIENLAEALGAAVGASRAVVDAGWRPHQEQVGQTGKTVSPSLYIACGISGAIQHLAGMSSSKYIVAINKDKEAPIFSIADYGIAGDVFEIIPALTEEIKKIKSS